PRGSAPARTHESAARNRPCSRSPRAAYPRPRRSSRGGLRPTPADGGRSRENRRYKWEAVCSSRLLDPREVGVGHEPDAGDFRRLEGHEDIYDLLVVDVLIALDENHPVLFEFDVRAQLFL